MTRNWIVRASRALRMVGPAPGRSRRHRTSPHLETLEHRLSLSVPGAGTVTAMLNPQPLPLYAPPRLPIIGGGPTDPMMRKAGGENEVHRSHDLMPFPCGGVCGSVDLNLFMPSTVRKAGEDFDH